MNNIKKVWTGIKSIININKCKNSYIPSLYDKHKINLQDVANIFDHYFVNVGKKTEKNILKLSRLATSYLTGDYTNSIF